MAHRMKIEPIPHKNKDGKFSKTKKDYQVIDKTRRGRVLVGVAPTQDAGVKMFAEHRERIIAEHIRKNPNDTHFIRKHKIEMEK